jgi:p-hydroxybenzoate 3-monooxygenase
LTDALARWYESGARDGLERYSSACLRRVWRAQHFSYWMTNLLHSFSGDDSYARKLQLAYLDYVVHSQAASRTLAENYVGFEWER